MKIYSFFLPQFHETEHNNRWWGKGFTEWNLVKKADKKYPNHHQPRIPKDGYFDLTEENEFNRQAKTAKEHGIDGYVIYHYWYEGERILEKPVEILLNNPEIDIEFSLCWANHSWTRSWRNRTGALDSLIEQTYEVNYEERCLHYSYLLRIFRDRRCIKVNGKPCFHIYKPDGVENLEIFIKELREFVFKKEGIEIHISGILSDWKRNFSFIEFLDSVTLSQPALALYAPNNVLSKKIGFFKNFNVKTLVRSLPKSFHKILFRLQDLIINDRIKLVEYDDIWSKIIEQTQETQKINYDLDVFPSAFIDFDNTARYNNRALIMKGFSPSKFGEYFKKLLEVNSSKITFIYAWNEWSEGMYLQADEKYNNQRLEEVKKAMLLLGTR